MAAPRTTREVDVQYMLLLYGEEPAAGPEPTAEQMEAYLAPWWDYDKALKDAGVHIAGEALQPSTATTTLRLKESERVITDGPFAETREVLGGFYLIDVPDLDAALDWAARCPGAAEGPIEVRPFLG